MQDKMSDITLSTNYDKVKTQYSNQFGINLGFNTKKTNNELEHIKPLQQVLKTKKR